MILVFILFWTLVAIFGNEFMQANLVKGLNPFYLLILYSWTMYALKIINGKSKVTDSSNNQLVMVFNWIFKIYVAWFCLYTLLSFFGFFKIFPISDFGYDRQFVLRQAYVIMTVPCGILITEEIINKNTIEQLKPIGIAIFIGILIGLRYFFQYDSIPYRPLLLLFSSFLLFNYDNIFSFILFLITIYVSDLTQSSYILGYLSIIGIYFLNKFNFRFFDKKMFLFNLASALIMISLFILCFQKILMAVQHDPNSMWRWQYWTHEIRIIAQTYGFGVGYGVPYASKSILYEVNNNNMFLVNSEGAIQENTMLYIVAQHNSLMNQFYRLGVVGGSLFLILNCFLLGWYKSVRNRLRSIASKNYLAWGFSNYILGLTIILLNPGMESPRFYLSFLFAVAILVGLLKKFSKNRFDKNQVMS